MDHPIIDHLVSTQANHLSRLLRNWMTIILTALLISPMIGCRAKPAKGTDFVNTTQMSNDPLLPFNRVWISPDYKPEQYLKIYIAPINTAYMLKTTDWQKGERKDQITKDVKDLGDRTQNVFKKAFQNDPKHRMQVVESATKDPQLLVVEFALVEVVPSKVALNALGFAPFFIGTTINIFRAMADDVSTVAMEARMRDGATSEIVATYADRQAQQASLLSVRGLTWYSHAEVIIDEWAKQFVQIANRKPGEKIKQMDTFTLKPW